MIKMNYMGFTRPLLGIIKSFSTQFVNVNGHESHRSNFISGILLSSILSLLVFNLNIDDLIDINDILIWISAN